MSASAPRRRRNRHSRPWLLWSVLGAIGLCAIGMAGVTVWANSFLRSDAFRELINSKSSDFLKAEVRLSPFSYEGWTIYAEQMEGTGFADSFFSQMTATGVRAEVNLRAALRKTWHITEVNVREVDLTFPTAESLGNVQEATSRRATASGLAGLVPTRFELDRVRIHSMTSRWKLPGGVHGAIEGSQVELIPTAQSLEISASRGAVRQSGAPDLTLDSFRARYQRHELFVTEAQFRLKEGGMVRISGEAGFEPPEHVMLHGELDRISVTPFLPEDWRMRLHGSLLGHFEVKGNPTRPEELEVRGTVTLSEGKLEALPFLEKLSEYLKASEFRSMALQNGVAEFQYRNGVLTVSEFGVESVGLFKVSGNLTVQKNGELSGMCRVGVSTRTLQWLPAAQVKIFDLEKDGYVWTDAELGGTSKQPSENLTRRLVTSAAETVVEHTRTVIETGKDASKQATDVMRDTTRSAFEFLIP